VPEIPTSGRPTSTASANAAWRGLRTRRNKYTVHNGRPWHRHDLLEDPYEMNNLIDSAKHRAIRAHLHA
jgi:hypothetical protein